MKNKKTIVISISSDISLFLIDNVLKKHRIIGTYRTLNKRLKQIKKIPRINLLKLDISKKTNIQNFFYKNKKLLTNWDNCIVSVGGQKPIGRFEKLETNEISTSIDINFKNQIILLNLLLSLRKKRGIKNVITWAGPGTNNANKLYFPYTISKIALIKSMELLDYEIGDVKFCILGPGWVKTKIHKETLKNKKNSEKNFNITKKVLKGNLNIDTPISDIDKCVDWVFRSKKKEVGGKNFSVKHDEWKSPKFMKKLLDHKDYYKLRRKS